MSLRLAHCIKPEDIRYYRPTVAEFAAQVLKGAAWWLVLVFVLADIAVWAIL